MQDQAMYRGKDDSSSTIMCSIHSMGCCKGLGIIQYFDLQETGTPKRQTKTSRSQKILGEIFEKINTAIADSSLSYTVNFNYQVFSVCDLPIPASTSTPTFESKLGIEVDTTTIMVIPEVPEHSFYLMQWLRIG